MMKLDIQMFADGGKVVIPIEADTKSFEAQIKETENVLSRLEKKYKEFDKHQGTKRNEVAMAKLREQIEKTTNKLIGLRAKQDELDHPPSNAIEWSEKFGEGLKKSIKNVSRLILGIFGIRGAYMAVRSAMNTISSQDEQLSADIQYMKNALAYAIEPIIRGIVNIAKQLLFYVGAIIKVWTGKNIFANANKSLKGATGSAKALNKELNKTTASFDEMNVLSDTSSKGGGDTGGVASPTFDLSNLDDYELKVLEIESKWKSLGDTIKDLLYNTSIDEWIDSFGYWGIAIRGVVEIAYGLWEVVDGIIEFIKGAVNFVVALITGDTKKMKESVVQMLDGIWKVIDGLVHIIWGLIQALLGSIIALLFTVVDWIADYVIKPIANFFAGLWSGIVNGVSSAIKFVKDIFNGLISFFSFIINKIIGFFTYIGTAVGDVIGGAFKGVINGVLWAIESILNTPIKAINKLIDVINKVPGINLGKLSTFKLPRLAKGGIINMPGKGVPVGSAIGGEHGAEGVIPLTDSQQMALLGEAIGKYININATIPVYVGNRQIARELRKINAEDEFARNS